MENKINIAELLKDCPKGMELDCTMFEKPVKYIGLTKNETYIIAIKTSCDKFFCLTKEGYLYDTPDSKCVIFPKGKTTWEGFVPPCKFKVGDKVVFNDAKEKPLTIRKIWWDWQAKEILCSFEEDDIDVPVKDLDRYIKPKFDITTLKPFDKVLVRNKSNEVWTANFYSHYDATSDKPFICVGWSEMNEYRYCIPYEVNNELLGTTNNTEEYGSR